MQQKEIRPDWRLLEDLAANQEHYHHHHHHHSSGPGLFGSYYDQHHFFSELASSRASTHCRFHTAYASFIQSYLQQHTPHRPRKLSSSSSRSSRTLCTSPTSHTPRTSRSTVVPGLLSLQRPTKLRARNRGCRVISVRLTPPRLPWPVLPSMHRTPLSNDRSVQDIRAIVSNIVPPHAAISSVQLLPHHRLPQVYEVKLSDMTTMLVVLPPLSMLRLLRSEQNMLRSEAAVVRWLHDELLELPASLEPNASGLHPLSTTPAGAAAIRQKLPDTCQTRKTRAGSTSLSVVSRTDLLRYLPSPVSLYSQTQPLDSANLHSFTPPTPSTFTSPSLSSFSSLSSSLLTFNVFRPPVGTPIAALSAPLTAAERTSIDYQAGKLMRRLSRITSKSGNFGPALAVLTPQSSLGPPPSSDFTIGMSSWSVAFHSILESILRDGEDLAVALAYPTIRKHFRRLGHSLDSVTTPSLVVFDAMDDTNLLVQRSPVLPQPTGSQEGTGLNTASQKPPKQRSASPTSPTVQEGFQDAYCESVPSPPQREARSASSPPFVEPSSDIVVTGLRDWSHCIFGDPLFASVFCEQPSKAFLGGFNSVDHDSEQTAHDLLSCQDERENRAVRILLYQCYHAVVRIVRGFYRPGRDQTTQELTARKRLTEILAKLEAIDDDPKRRFRHRRPSGEMSPAKKPKSESGDETPRR